MKTPEIYRPQFDEKIKTAAQMRIDFEINSAFVFDPVEWDVFKAQFENYIASNNLILSDVWQATLVMSLAQASDYIQSPQSEYRQVVELVEKSDEDHLIIDFLADPKKYNWHKSLVIISHMLQSAASDDQPGFGRMLKLNPPFAQIALEPGSRLEQIAANLGHDITSLPFAQMLVKWPNALIRRLKSNKIPISDYLKFYKNVFPGVYRGTLDILEAYRQMASGASNSHTELDLSRDVLDSCISMALVKVFDNSNSMGRIVLQLEFNGANCQIYLNDPESEQKDINKMIVNVRCADNLYISGDRNLLDLALYQQLKNTIGILRFSDLFNDHNYPQIDIDAGRVTLVHPDGRDHDMIAVRIRDNGPGLNITEILKSKQKKVQREGVIYQGDEKFQNQWVCLDLRLRDIINAIFERRISGNGRSGSHSGLGLDMAMEIIDAHGGAIWATNNHAQEGAEFMFIFDPTPVRSLRRVFPELIPQNGSPVPIELMQQIELGLNNLPVRRLNVPNHG